MSYTSISKVTNIALVGGTHGNEITGVNIIKKYELSPQLIQRSTFKVHTLLANPRATELGRRYVDIDLNRCFKPQDLINSHLSNYEQIRAKQIAQDFQNQNINLILDLHSTTSNLGVTLILNSNHPWLLCLAAYISSINPLVKVLQYQSSHDAPYLRSLTELGLAIEVGAVSQGIMNPELFIQTEKVIQQILDYVESFNQGRKSLKIPNTLTLYRQVSSLDYPRDNNNKITAMIHPKVFMNDYHPLNTNQPLFLGFNGQEIGISGKKKIFSEGESVDYFPIFVGEAAYIEKGIAMSLTIKKQIAISC